MRKRVEEMNEGELMERARRTARLDSDRARRYRRRKRDQGEMRITMYVPREAADHVRSAMEEALADWERGQGTVVPFPAPAPAGGTSFLRIEFSHPAEAAPVRQDLRDRGFLFLPEHGGWCGPGDAAAINALVAPSGGRTTPLPPESGMVRTWERYRSC